MKNIFLLAFSGAAAAAALSLSGCKPAEHHDHDHAHGHGHDQAHAHHEHGHKAAHGGCLHALGTCENGHVETRLTGDTLELWFVGGGSDTEKAVRIPDAAVTLHITAQGAAPRPLVLAARPNELADEKVGDCSQFVGKAEWLKGLAAFKATGEVTFRGHNQAVVIDYPKGYDPD